LHGPADEERATDDRMFRARIQALFERHGLAIWEERVEIWLYQMSESQWSINNFRDAVREGRLQKGVWDERRTRKYRFGRPGPALGDLVFFYFAPTGAAEPGLCGLGEIAVFDDEKQFRFRALPPTQTLMQRPRWGSRMQELITIIRGGAPQGTWWRVRRLETALELYREALSQERVIRARQSTLRRKAADKAARRRY
jgi:hypothetical protein